MVVLMLMLTAVASFQSPDPDVSFKRLAWLAGCWSSVEGPGSTDSREHWLPAGREALIGVSRTVASGALRSYEFLVIRRQQDQIVYIAKPSGQPEATFTLRSATDDEMIFENPAHDFPQRIIYRRAPNDALVARIEGTERGRSRGVDFPMRRTTCP